MLFWRHAAWLERSSAKHPVYINIDETALAYSFHAAPGLIQRKFRAEVQVRPQDARGCITHVALASNVLGVQTHLPQILICNKRRLTRSLEQQLQSLVPSTVTLCREDSSWNSSRTYGLLATAPGSAVSQPLSTISADYCLRRSLVPSFARRHKRRTPAGVIHACRFPPA